MGALTGATGPAGSDGPGLGIAGFQGREDVAWYRVDDPSVPGAARRGAMELAARVGFGETRIGEVGIVVTEAATNLLKYDQDGALVLRLAARCSPRPSGPPGPWFHRCMPTGSPAR